MTDGRILNIELNFRIVFWYSMGIRIYYNTSKSSVVVLKGGGGVGLLSDCERTHRCIFTFQC